eukprot:1183273-Prorocentrum_minimum.AAC.2
MVPICPVLRPGSPRPTNYFEYSDLSWRNCFRIWDSGSGPGSSGSKAGSAPGSALKPSGAMAGSTPRYSGSTAGPAPGSALRSSGSTPGSAPGSASGEDTHRN